jgi:hypothetical protein
MLIHRAMPTGHPHKRKENMFLGDIIMKNIKYVTCLLLVFMSIWAFAGTGSVIKKESIKEQIDKLSTLNVEKRIELLEQISNEYYVMQGNLIYLLGNTKSNDVKFAAAYLLGIYRMEQSVRELSKFITLEYISISPESREFLWDRYPIAEALTRIGKPSVSEMLKNIQTSEDEKVREIYALVIGGVEGPNVGRFVIENAMKKAQPLAKSSLQKALELDYFELPATEPNKFKN